MALSTAEKKEILDAIKAESQDVTELDVVSSLNGITSLPTMQGEKLVLAPITLLEKPATDAAAIANAATTAAEKATTQANNAALAATTAANEADKAREAANNAAMEAASAAEIAGILKFDGMVGSIAGIPTSETDKVFFCTAEKVFAKNGETLHSPYNVAADSGYVANTAYLFRQGNDLYHYNGSTLVRLVDEDDIDDAKNELTEYADDIAVLLTADIRDAEIRAVATAQENVGIYPFDGLVGVEDEIQADDDKIYYAGARKAFYRNRSLLGSPYNKVDGSTVYPASNIFRCGSRLFRGTPTGLVALQDALSNSAEITVDNDQRLHLTTDAQRALFNAAFDQAAAGYGKFDPANAPDEQHPYLLNDLWLSYEEAFEVMSWPRLGYANGTGLYMNAQIRTTLPSYHSFGMILPNCSLLFANAGKIERIALPIAVGRRCFQRCHKLQHAKVYRLFDDNPGTDVFAECYSLQTVDFVDMPSRVSFDIHWSPLLDFATVERFATKAPSTGAAMTIIFHADVYAKLTGDTANGAAAALSSEELTEWMAVANTFATKNIAIATV